MAMQRSAFCRYAACSCRSSPLSLSLIHIYREHCVHAVFQPGGDQAINPAVAVNGDNVDAMAGKQARDALVMRSDALVKGGGDDKRTILKADILPEMGIVKLRPGIEHSLHAVIALSLIHI